VADLEAAVALNEHQYQAHEGLGQVRLRQNRLDDAVAQFTRAIAVRPDLAPLYRARADAELARKDPNPAQRSRALHDLEDAIRLERPDNPVLARDHTTRGRLLHCEHREDDALAAAGKAFELVPTYADAHRLRLDILLSLKKFEEVIGSCDALLAQKNKRADLFELRGLARAAKRDYAGAIEDDTEALSLGPRSASLLARRGWLYVLTDAPRLAVRDFDEAIRVESSSSDAHLGRGAALVRLGRHRQAVVDVEQALQLGEPTARMLYNAARVFAQAATAARSEVPRIGRDALSQVNRYLDRAVELIQMARKLLPADQRSSFQSDVLHDPDLSILYRRLR
jgi:tetratricopeptide (TPR) repeat protein